MKSCFACGGEIDEWDRYCGACGAATTGGTQAAPLPPSPPVERRRPRALALGLTVLAVPALAAAGYLAFSQPPRPPAPDRPAPARLADIEAPAPPPLPTETPSAAASPSDQPSDAPTVPADQLASPMQAGRISANPQITTAGVIQPGRWLFTLQLENISKVDPSDDSFDISRQGIGARETSAMCVTPEIAANPGAIAFPFQSTMGCNPSSFSMADGAYRSSMSCSFPQFGGRRPVEASGKFSRLGVLLDVRVRVPAKVVSGSFARPPEILMQYSMTGNLSGPC